VSAASSFGRGREAKTYPHVVLMGRVNALCGKVEETRVPRRALHLKAGVEEELKEGGREGGVSGWIV